MQIQNLSVNSFDISLMAVWAALLPYNPAAAVMVIDFAAYASIQAITATNFQAFLICSTLYFYFAQSYIKFLSTFRKPFLCFGAVYFIGAIDQAIYYHFEFDTFFDRIQPYLIITINAYILAMLINGGGKQDAGFVNNIAMAFRRWFVRLS